ncbi:MAG: DUF3850 domain-containing protein [Candidatus Atribacteria bacterium]|nr:DUF3850 domain-containing protein [Candidatus Atribacteria bacterium]
MRLHELKIWPDFFNLTVSGKKNFEIRVNDRGFEVLDRLLLREFNPSTQAYTGREHAVSISHMLDHTQLPLLKEGTVLLFTKLRTKHPL